MAKNVLTVSQTLGGLTPIIDAQQQALAEIKAADNPASRSIAEATGLINVMAAITHDTLAVLDVLQGTAIGFGADRHYRPDELKSICMQALVKGAMLTGEEFSAIRGKLYLGKAYYERVLHEHPDITDIKLQLGVPEELKPDVFLFSAIVACKYQGLIVGERAIKTKQGDFRLLVPVQATRWDKQSGQEVELSFSDKMDNAAGKARKRMLQRLWDRITLGAVTEADDVVLLEQPLPEPIGTRDDLVEPTRLVPIEGTEHQTRWSERFRGTSEHCQQLGREVFEALSHAGLRDLSADVNHHGLTHSERELLCEFIEFREQLDAAGDDQTGAAAAGQAPAQPEQGVLARSGDIRP